MKREPLIAAAAVAVVVVVFAGTLLVSSPGQTTATAYPTFSLNLPSTTSSVGAAQVAFEDHIVAIESKNLSATIAGYYQNATLVLEGGGAFRSSGFAGSYSGTPQLREFYSDFFSGLTLTFSDLSVRNLSQFSVNATFDFFGNSPIIGPVSGSASDAATFLPSSGSLAIVTETLDFVNFSAPGLSGAG